jgi:hypothetical protein
MEMHVFVALEPHVAVGFVGGEIVEHGMDFALRIGGDDPVHEVEKFDAPASLVVAATTSPLATLRAANSVVVPWRL